MTSLAGRGKDREIVSREQDFFNQSIIDRSFIGRRGDPLARVALKIYETMTTAFERPLASLAIVYHDPLFDVASSVEQV